MELLVAAIAGVALFVYHRQIAEALENFRNNFPRGPRTPMHPSPARDSELLRRRPLKRV